MVVEEMGVSDGEVKVFRVGVGNGHQTGQDDQEGNSPEYFPAHTTFRVLPFCCFLVCLWPKRCHRVVSERKQFESFRTAAYFSLKSKKSKKSPTDKNDNVK